MKSYRWLVATQLVAWWLFFPRPGILALTPILITAGVFFGLFNVIIASSKEKRLANTV